MRRCFDRVGSCLVFREKSSMPNRHEHTPVRERTPRRADQNRPSSSGNLERADQISIVVILGRSEAKTREPSFSILPGSSGLPRIGPDGSPEDDDQPSRSEQANSRASCATFQFWRTRRGAPARAAAAAEAWSTSRRWRWRDERVLREWESTPSPSDANAAYAVTLAYRSPSRLLRSLTAAGSSWRSLSTAP